MSKYFIAVFFWTVSPLITVLLYLFILLNQARIYVMGEPQDGRAHHRVACLWGRTMINMIPVWKIEIEGKEFLPEDHDPVVIVANHESMADIWALFCLGIQFRWFAKDETRKIPVIGQAMRWAGYIFIKRGSRSSAAAALRKSREALDNGLSMIFFPEGTRSKDGKIKDFKLGAFKLAKEAEVDVLPIAIHGAGILFPKGSFLPNPATIRVKVLPRVPVPQDVKDLSGFATHIRDKIIEAHATIT